MVAAAMLVFATPALSDDQAACVEGIAAAKAELAKKSLAEPALGTAKRALRIAERERREGEFDECLEALDDAKRVLE